MPIRKPNNNETFLLSLAFNALLNFHWTIPAWIFLVLHFAIGLSIWWFVGAIVAWLAAMTIIALFFLLVDHIPTDTEPRKKSPRLEAYEAEHSRATKESDTNVVE